MVRMILFLILVLSLMNSSVSIEPNTKKRGFFGMLKSMLFKSDSTKGKSIEVLQEALRLLDDSTITKIEPTILHSLVTLVEEDPGHIVANRVLGQLFYKNNDIEKTQIRLRSNSHIILE